MVLDKTSCELLMYLLDQESPKTIMTISKIWVNQGERSIITLIKLMMHWAILNTTLLAFLVLVST